MKMKWITSQHSIQMLYQFQSRFRGPTTAKSLCFYKYCKILDHLNRWLMDQIWFSNANIAWKDKTKWLMEVSMEKYLLRPGYRSLLGYAVSDINGHSRIKGKWWEYCFILVCMQCESRLTNYLIMGMWIYS